MTGKTHLAMGIASGMLCGAMVPEGAGEPAVMGVCIATCAIGSLFPDIDTPTSLLGRCVKPLSTFLNRVCGHRGRDEYGNFVNSAFQGFVHTPANGALLSFLLYLLLDKTGLPVYPAFVFGFGFFIHLLQDTMTKGGIPWLWPLRLKNYRLLKMKSGDWLEVPISFFLFIFLSAVVANLGMIHDSAVAELLEPMRIANYVDIPDILG